MQIQKKILDIAQNPKAEFKSFTNQDIMENSLAYELLQEVKRTNKRLFVIVIVELVIIVSMIVGFLIYESQFQYSTSSEEIYTQETSNNDSSDITQSIN